MLIGLFNLFRLQICKAWADVFWQSASYVYPLRNTFWVLFLSSAYLELLRKTCLFICWFYGLFLVLGVLNKFIFQPVQYFVQKIWNQILNLLCSFRHFFFFQLYRSVWRIKIFYYASRFHVQKWREDLLKTRGLLLRLDDLSGKVNQIVLFGVCFSL